MESGRLVESNTSRYLAQGQNFYDQPPFNHVIEDADKTQSAIPHLRTLLTCVCYQFVLRSGDEPALYRTSRDLSVGLEKMDYTGRLFVLHVVKGRGSLASAKRQYGKYLPSLSQIARALKEYPYWADYIGSQREAALYETNGAYKQKGGTWTLRRTHTGLVKWVRQCAEGEKRYLRKILLVHRHKKHQSPPAET